MKTKITLMVVVGLLAGSVGAALIAVPDAGFEGITATWAYIQPVSGSASTNPPTGEWSAQDNSRAWVGNNTGGYPTPAAHGGDSWGALNNTTISQSFAETYVEGYTYTLSFWAQETSAGSYGIYARLNDGTGSDGYTGSQDVKQLTIAATTGDWVEYSVVHTAVAADVGQNIGISLWGEPGKFVDDVTLTYAIPEPASLGLIGVFGGAVLFIRRKLMI